MRVAFEESTLVWSDAEGNGGKSVHEQTPAELAGSSEESQCQSAWFLDFLYLLLTISDEFIAHLSSFL